jgi:hypothetical protein
LTAFARRRAVNTVREREAFMRAHAVRPRARRLGPQRVRLGGREQAHQQRERRQVARTRLVRVRVCAHAEERLCACAERAGGPERDELAEPHPRALLELSALQAHARARRGEALQREPDEARTNAKRLPQRGCFVRRAALSWRERCTQLGPAALALGRGRGSVVVGRTDGTVDKGPRRTG